MQTVIEPFSESYYQLPYTETRGYNGESIVGPHDLVDQLAHRVGRETPVVRIGRGHYRLEGQAAVPSDTIAVPFDSEVPTDAEPVLVPREGVDF